MLKLKSKSIAEVVASPQCFIQIVRPLGQKSFEKKGQGLVSRRIGPGRHLVWRQDKKELDAFSFSTEISSPWSDQWVNCIVRSPCLVHDGSCPEDGLVECRTELKVGSTPRWLPMVKRRDERSFEVVLLRTPRLLKIGASQEELKKARDRQISGIKPCDGSGFSVMILCRS